MNWCTTTARCLPRNSPAQQRGPRRHVALGASLALGALIWAGWSLASPTQAGGEALYRRGLLPSRAPVHAIREASASVEAVDAACVNCHRRSGLGSTEGLITIPPIAGPYLFAPRGKSLEDLGIPFVDG